MSGQQWTVLCTAVFLVGLLVGALSATRWVRSQVKDSTDFDRSRRTQDTIRELYQAITILGRRYEVRIQDGGEHVNPDMRWRWVVWDADRVMRVQASSGPLEDTMGVEMPYMLGDSPTRPEAEAQALGWLAAQGAEGVVL